MSTNFSTQNLVQIRACVISARKAKHIDVTTMFTYSHVNTPLDQSVCAYYLSYFIKQFIIMQCVTLLLIHVDTGLQELYLSLLVMGIHCTMRWYEETYASWSSRKWEYQWSWDKSYCLRCKSKSVLKMCISKHCLEVTGFLSRIGTSCKLCSSAKK